MDPDTRRLARQRVQILFRLADDVIGENPALAQRYTRLARRIAMAARIRLPRDFRRQVCRRCKSLILPGVNCRVRIRQNREPHVVVTCFNCDKQTRIPLRKRKERSKL